MAVETNTVTDPMESFYQDLEGRRLDALWRRVRGEERPSGRPAPYPPCRWRWTDVRPMMDRAAELVRPGPDAHRRVLQLVNPGVGVGAGTTHTLSAAVQMVLPGEVAPSHRHTMAALRFILEGEAAVTIVDGEPCSMSPGDLVLTPGWAFHGHLNQSHGPMVWMDCLDRPLVHSLRAAASEPYPDELEPANRSLGDSYSRYGTGHLRPSWQRTSSAVSPLLAYPWEQTKRSLHELAGVDASPYDDVSLDYTNPATGGPVLPTIGCRIQMLRPGVHTQAHRHSASAVYHVFRGSGSTIVDGVRLDWEQGDFFALSPNCWHEHVNGSVSDEAILFSTNDGPVLDSLYLSYEEPFAERDGHQEVTGTYAD